MATPYGEKLRDKTGVSGSIKIDVDNNCFWGTLDVPDGIYSYEGDTAEELYDSFLMAVQEWYEDTGLL